MAIMDMLLSESCLESGPMLRIPQANFIFAIGRCDAPTSMSLYSNERNLLFFSKCFNNLSETQLDSEEYILVESKCMEGKDDFGILTFR